MNTAKSMSLFGMKMVVLGALALYLRTIFYTDLHLSYSTDYWVCFLSLGFVELGIILGVCSIMLMTIIWISKE
jgi:hypothetical protein